MTELHEQSTRSGQAATVGEARWLLVVAPRSSWRVELPACGRMVVGRAPDVELRVDDESVSRRHVQVATREGELTVSDLDSHNGTRVNGEPLVAMRRLWAGDVIQIGDVVLVVHGGGAPATAIVDADDLRRRLDDEIERAAAFDRTLALVALSGDDRAAIAPELRSLDRVATVGGRLFVIAPELDREDVAALAARWAKRLGAGASAGFATCPDDGADAGALLGAARDALAAAAPGAVVDASSTVLALSLGGRPALLADPAMVRLVELTRRVARGELAVLVVGETGTGKELVARGVHELGPRAPGPFVGLNCAAVQDALVESELFGYDKGAFTGAVGAKPGLLEAAHGGTLFLDEVGELSAAMQAKLLRAIDGKRFTRLGSVVERAVDVRIVAATNRDLDQQVAAGRFRSDLFFRLSGATIAIPPLRDRPRDVAVLARAFLDEACARARRDSPRITAGTMRALTRHPWPGNVRELRNAMENVSTLDELDVLNVWSLPAKLTGVDEPTQPITAGRGRFRPVSEELAELERRRMREAIEAADGVLKAAAQLIGMPLRTFHMKAKQYGLTSRRRDD